MNKAKKRRLWAYKSYFRRCERRVKVYDGRHQPLGQEERIAKYLLRAEKKLPLFEERP